MRPRHNGANCGLRIADFGLRIASGPTRKADAQARSGGAIDGAADYGERRAYSAEAAPAFAKPSSAGEGRSAAKAGDAERAEKIQVRLGTLGCRVMPVRGAAERLRSIATGASPWKPYASAAPRPGGAEDPLDRARWFVHDARASKAGSQYGRGIGLAEIPIAALLPWGFRSRLPGEGIPRAGRTREISRSSGIIGPYDGALGELQPIQAYFSLNHSS